MIQRREEDAKKIHHQASHIIYFFLSLVVENKIKHLIKYFKKINVFTTSSRIITFLYTLNPHDFQTCIYFMCTRRRKSSQVDSMFCRHTTHMPYTFVKFSSTPYIYTKPKSL